MSRPSHILVSPQVRRQQRRRHANRRGLPSLKSQPASQHYKALVDSKAALPRIFAVGEGTDTHVSISPPKPLLRLRSKSADMLESTPFLLKEQKSTKVAASKRAMEILLEDRPEEVEKRRSAIQTPNVLLGHVTRESSTEFCDFQKGLNRLASIEEQTAVRVELDENQGCQVVESWLASYEKEKASFGSVALFAEVRLREVVNELGRDGKSRPVKALAAICSDLLCKLAGLFGRYGELMAVLHDQLLRCIFADYDDVLKARELSGHTEKMLGAREFFCMTPWFSVASQNVEVQRAKDRWQRHLASETKGAIARMHQAQAFLRNACFLVWKKYIQQQLYLIKMMRRRAQRRVLHGIREWIKFKATSPRMYSLRKFWRRWLRRRPKHLFVRRRDEIVNSSFTVNYSPVKYYQTRQEEKQEDSCEFFSKLTKREEKQYTLNMMDMLDSLIKGKTHDEILSALDNIFSDPKLLKFIRMKCQFSKDEVRDQAEKLAEEFKQMQQEAETQKSMVTKQKMMMGVMRAMGQHQRAKLNEANTEVETIEIGVQTPTDWKNIDGFNNRRAKKKKKPRAKVAMLLDQIEVQRAPDLPIKTALELIPNFYEEYLKQNSLFKREEESSDSDSSSSDDIQISRQNTPSISTVARRKSSMVRKQSIGRKLGATSQQRRGAAQTSERTNMLEETIAAFAQERIKQKIRKVADSEVKPFHEFVHDCLIRRFGIKALAMKYQRGLMKTMEKEAENEPRLRVFQFVYGVMNQDGEFEVPNANRTSFFFRILREIFHSPKQVCAIMNSRQRLVERDRVIQAAKNAFQQLAESDPDEMAEIITAINDIPVESIIHGKTFKINVDVALDVLRGFWRKEIYLEDSAAATNEASRMISRFMRMIRIRLKTKRTQLSKIENIFYEYDMSIHLGKETGVLTYHEFRQLIARLGYPHLQERMMLKLFQEWSEKSDWLESQEKARNVPKNFDKMLSPDNRQTLQKISNALVKEKTRKSLVQEPTDSKGSTAWKGALLYARYGFLWQEFGKKDREMAQNCEARRGAHISRRAFALTMLDKGFYVLH